MEGKDEFKKLILNIVLVIILDDIMRLVDIDFDIILSDERSYKAH